MTKRQRRLSAAGPGQLDAVDADNCGLSRQGVEQLTLLLASLVSSYRVLVSTADELSGMALARRSQVEKAISRANKLGKVVDQLIKGLDHSVDGYQAALCQADERPASTGAMSTGYGAGPTV